jgi:hypothetical protein
LQILLTKPEVPVVNAIQQLSFILISLNVLTVVKIDYDYHEVLQALQSTSLKDRVTFQTKILIIIIYQLIHHLNDYYIIVFAQAT